MGFLDVANIKMTGKKQRGRVDPDQLAILARVTKRLLIRARGHKQHDLLALLTHAHRLPDSYKSHLTGGRQELGELELLLRQNKGVFALRKRTGPRRAKFTFIDLFCGIGGFRLAGDNAGGMSVFSSEIDKHARTAYFLNFGDMPFGDITHFCSGDKAGWVPSHDVLCGGFPCQAFSISGKRRGFGDPRGTLFGRICDIIDAKIRINQPPRVVFLENVKNFRRHDNGNTYATVELELAKRGYRVVSQVVDSAKLGSPTKRERIFIIAVLEKEIEARGEQQWIRFFDELREVAQGVMNSPRLELSECLRTDLSAAEIAVLKVKRVDDLLVKMAKEEDSRIEPDIRPKVIARIGLGRQGERVYSIKGTAITFSAYGGGVGARTGAYLIGDVIRKLDPSECANVMGFVRKPPLGTPKGTKPDRPMDTALMIDSGIGRMQLYKQFGNSVVVPVVERLFKAIRSCWLS